MKQVGNSLPLEIYYMNTKKRIKQLKQSITLFMLVSLQYGQFNASVYDHLNWRLNLCIVNSLYTVFCVIVDLITNHLQNLCCKNVYLDLANPKTNQKTSGFTKEERASFTTLLEESKFVDSFRHLYPDKKDAYSYWSYRSNARANNKGWYVTYYIVTN